MNRHPKEVATTKYRKVWVIDLDLTRKLLRAIESDDSSHLVLRYESGLDEVAWVAGASYADIYLTDAFKSSLATPRATS